MPTASRRLSRMAAGRSNRAMPRPPSSVRWCAGAVARGAARRVRLRAVCPCGVARLQDARLATLEDRIEAELRVGRGAELVPELERLVARASAAGAAHRGTDARAVPGRAPCGRARGVPGGARAAGRGTRPGAGPELRELERRILQHDPTLATHAGRFLPPGGARSDARGGRGAGSRSSPQRSLMLSSGAAHRDRSGYRAQAESSPSTRLRGDCDCDAARGSARRHKRRRVRCGWRMPVTAQWRASIPGRVSSSTGSRWAVSLGASPAAAGRSGSRARSARPSRGSIRPRKP